MGGKFSVEHRTRTPSNPARPLFWWAIALGTAAVLCAAGGIALVIATQAAAGPYFEVGKWLLSLAIALAVGGGASFIVKQVEQTRADQLRVVDQIRAEQAAWGDLLRQVVEVDEALTTAQQFILAHKTAKTYADQYKRLLDARLTLRRVLLDPLVANNSQRKLQEYLRQMLKYVETIGVEYEEHYLPVARQQRADEELLTTLAKATTAASGSPDARLYEPTPAWKMLEDRSKFRALNRFLDRKEYETSKFLTAFAEAKVILEKLCGIERSAPYVPIVLGEQSQEES